MHLSEIWVYPIKSLRGIRLSEASVEVRGLKYDRRWMIVDENGIFVTQRTNPEMALLNVAFDPEGLLISHHYRSGDKILVPFEPTSTTSLKVKVWKDVVTARTVCDRLDAWISQQLGKKLRIVEMTEYSHRKINPVFAYENEQLSFADDFPYLLISEASLGSLNTQLTVPVGMDRFRPNFVIASTQPFEEDCWKGIKIGDLTFRIASSCERCVLVNVDTETGVKSREPLRTLARFRQIEKKVLFGQNLISITQGIVREGDLVEV